MAQDLGGMYWTADIRTDGLNRAERDIQRSTRSAESGFNRVEKSTQRTEKSMMSLSRVAKGLAVVFAFRQLQQYTINTARAIDEQNNFAQSIGVTYENLQRLQFVTAQKGATQNELNNSLRRLARRTEEAASGTGSAVSAFEALNLNAKELQGLSPDEIFLRVADSFKDLTTSGEETRVAFGLFDTEGAKLINTLRQGRQYIEETGNALDNVISEEAAQAAAEFNSELDRMKQALGAAGGQAASEFLPAMTSMVNRFTELVNDGESVEKAINLLGIAAQASAAILAGRFVGSLVLAVQGMTAATVASRVLAGSLALVGGPAGIITAVGVGFVIMAAKAREAQRAFEDKETYIKNLTSEYRELNDAQKENIRLSAEEAKAAAEAQIARLKAQDPGERAQQSRRMAGGDRRGVSPSQDNARAERELSIEIEKQERIIERANRQLEALTQTKNESKDASDALTEAQGRNNASNEESERVLTSLAQRNEELRASIDGTTEAMEIRRAIQAAGVDAGSAEAAVIAELVRGNNELAEAVRARSEAEQHQRELERAAQSDIGLTRLQALEQSYARERDLLLQSQEAGIESEVAYQERLNELHRVYSEQRKEIIESETQTWKDRLAEVGFNFDALANQGVGALTSVAAGFQDGEGAARSLAQTVLTQALGAVIRFYAQKAMAKVIGDQQEIASETTKATTTKALQASTAASGAAAAATTATASAGAAAATTAAWTPAAIMASIGSFGGAVAVGLAAMAGIMAITRSSSSSKSPSMPPAPSTTGTRYGGGRRYGGPVNPGQHYEVGESNLPELYRQGSRQYLIPGNRGAVVSNRDMSQSNDNSQINLGGIHITAGGGMTAEEFQNMLFDSENAIYEIMRSAKAARGES